MKKILIVEDEVIIAMQLQMHLNKSGYTVCAPVRTGSDAIMSAKEEFPDLVLMDINLPGGVNGIDTMGEIMDFTYIPVVFMSGYEGEDVLGGLDLKYSFLYLKKPIQFYSLDDLLKTIFK